MMYERRRLFPIERALGFSLSSDNIDTSYLPKKFDIVMNYLPAHLADLGVGLFRRLGGSTHYVRIRRGVQAGAIVGD